MQNKIYSIKEASEELELENHTLRYYEDELKLIIPRNSLGHRYYREYDMKVFRDIRVLKEQGLQLKAIKTAIQSYYDPVGGDSWGESSEAYMQASAAVEESQFGYYRYEQYESRTISPYDETNLCTSNI